MGKLFNEDGRLRDPESLRSIYLGPTRRPRTWDDGGVKMTEQLHEDSGAVGAVVKEHGDGRVDAEVFAQPIAVGSQA